MPWRKKPRRWPIGCRRVNGAWARTANTCATSTFISGAGPRGTFSTIGPGKQTGIVCFITVAGFLSGPGFQKMRDYLRRTCDDIWVIDCSPEGHQPEVNTRIFQGVQQPVCIVLASRSASNKSEMPAKVHFQSLPAGHRTEKFAGSWQTHHRRQGWVDCPTDWRAPFLPASTGAWATLSGAGGFVHLQRLGRATKRTWVIAPDADSLERRWKELIAAPSEKKETLFHATLRDGKPAIHIRSVVHEALPGFSQI